MSVFSTASSSNGGLPVPPLPDFSSILWSGRPCDLFAHSPNRLLPRTRVGCCSHNHVPSLYNLIAWPQVFYVTQWIETPYWPKAADFLFAMLLIIAFPALGVFMQKCEKILCHGTGLGENSIASYQRNYNKLCLCSRRRIFIIRYSNTRYILSTTIQTTITACMLISLELYPLQ